MASFHSSSNPNWSFYFNCRRFTNCQNVDGADGADLITDSYGKDKLISGQGSDEFYFSASESLKKMHLDKVVDFESTEGHEIVLAGVVFGGLIDYPTPDISDTNKDLKQ